MQTLSNIGNILKKYPGQTYQVQVMYQETGGSRQFEEGLEGFGGGKGITGGGLCLP